MAEEIKTPLTDQEEQKKEEPIEETKKDEDKKEVLKTEEKKESQKSSKMGNTLCLDPETAYFNPGGGKSDHMLVNLFEHRLAVKIRSSNNQLYRVNPVTMFIESGQCGSLSVTRLPGPARPDKLVIQFIACSSEETDPKEVFTTLAKDVKPETIRLQLKMADQKKSKYTSWEICE